MKSGISYIGVLVSVLVLSGCDTGPAPSLYDPGTQSAPDPVLSSIEPEGSALAGVDIVTITGENFSEIPNNNLVYFGSTRAEVVDATPTRLRVLPPNEPREAITIRVAVLEAENFSNNLPYRLAAAAESFGSIANFEEVFAVTSDAEGNIYLSLFSDNRSIGIVRITPDGARSTFTETTFKWDAMTFGPDGMLYTARSVRALFRFQEGGSQETWVVIPDNSVRLSTIEFDAMGNLWAGGNNANIYRIAPDLMIEAFPLAADVRSIRFFESHLYVAGIQNGTSKVWRFSVSDAGDLGPAEEYFDVSGFGTGRALSLALTAGGELFIGTDNSDPLLLVSPDRNEEVFYPGILSAPATGLAWGTGTSLYMVKGRTGSSNSNILRINTRREGKL